MKDHLQAARHKRGARHNQARKLSTWIWEIDGDATVSWV
jgi:hypothetical protein